MADERVNFILAARDNATATIKRLRGELSAVGGAGATAAGPLGRLSAVTGGLVSPAALATAGALALTGAVVGAARAALEEERGIAALTQAIKANDPASAGQIDRIEETIRSRENLAFADDAQRESLAALVAVTRDSEKALQLQRVAMDLSRLKGMDLGKATELIGKVYAGNLGILSRYGIVLEKGTTATEALAEIQRRAAGQAEAYAETTSGSLESAGIVIEDVAEDLGGLLLPAIRDVALWTRDDLVPAVREAIDVLGELGDVDGDIPVVSDLGRFLDDVSDSGLRLRDMLTGEENKLSVVAERIDVDYRDLRASVHETMNSLGQDFDTALHTAEARAASSQLPQAFSTMMYAGLEAEIIPAVQAVTEAFPNSIEASLSTIRQKAYDSMVAHAMGIQDGQNLPQVAFDAAMKLVDEELTKEEESARLHGQLTTLEHAAGIAAQEGKTASLNAINAAITVITNRLADLEGEAYTYGLNTATEYALGLTAGYGVVRDAAGNLAAATRGQIGINSEPEDADSPLRGITRWGGNLVRTYADGINEALGLARNAGTNLAGAVAPSNVGLGVYGNAVYGNLVPGIGGGGGGPAVMIAIDNFYGTEDDIERLSREIARHLRLQGSPTRYAPLGTG